MNSLPLPLFFIQAVTVFGGPYRQKPPHMIGVKMAKEIKADCEIDIPTVDFSIPPAEAMEDGLVTAIQFLRTGEPLYVGCMGGIGRTGLFLAVLAKAFGIKDPVAYVRQHYYAHAVETMEQMAYVKGYTITPEMKREVFKTRFFLGIKSFFHKL